MENQVDVQTESSPVIEVPRDGAAYAEWRQTGKLPEAKQCVEIGGEHHSERTDDTGALLQNGSINLAARGHTSFMLAAAYRVRPTFGE
jgi:hypothetical protein